MEKEKFNQVNQLDFDCVDKSTIFIVGKIANIA